MKEFKCYDDGTLTCLEQEKLYAIYKITSNTDLISEFNCDRNFLARFCKLNNLKKDEDYLKNKRKEILTHRNKNITGRDLTSELLKEIALKYETKLEFQYKDASAYTTANRLGIMEDITKHMVNIYFSIPQIITRQITEYLLNEKCEYNTRKIISPYEIDIYFSKLKIGFEYDGKGWHQNDEVDKIKICKGKEIKLIILKERSRNYMSL